MAIYRNPTTGEIDRQEFENHLKAITRNEGYLEIIMYTPDLSIQVASVTSEDKLSICNMAALTNIDRYASSTIATLEENLWLLNGRFIVYQGGTIDGYISNSISNENGEFQNKPTMTVQLAHVHDIEDFSIVLNSAVPSGYPKDIKVSCYDEDDVLIGQPIVVEVESQVPTGEVDEHGDPIYKTVLLDSLPSVNFEINKAGVDHLVIEYGNTRFRHRRIRVSSIIFGKTIILDQESVTNVDYIDKTSYVCDTLPSRTFSFNVNNYSGIYNVDNPENGYVNLNRQTRVRFRNGYNVAGYNYDENGKVIMEDLTEPYTAEEPLVDEHGDPILDENNEPVVGTILHNRVLLEDAFPSMEKADTGIIELEWDNWKELRLMGVSANADESATFTAGSLLDIMEDIYTTDLYSGEERSVREVAEDVLLLEGLDLNSIEWSSDNIKRPTYDENHQLLPYSEWSDTSYDEYKINTSISEVQCKQVLQLIAFSIGATILIKDNGHIKFANLNLNDPSTFTYNYHWTYYDFESIPAAEQLESINSLSEISLPKYYSHLDYNGEEEYTDPVTGSIYSNLTVINTLNITSARSEVTYSDCFPIGCRLANDDTSGATIIGVELYSKRGLLNVDGIPADGEAKVEVLGYPIKTKQIQERIVTSNSLVLDTQIMQYDISTYNPNGSGAQAESEQIKRKYLTWYNKKFKYSFNTRGEPLVNAGDYGVIQTQFTGEMPVYILQNHWTFDGSWSGNMEVIALD